MKQRLTTTDAIACRKALDALKAIGISARITTCDHLETYDGDGIWPGYGGAVTIVPPARSNGWWVCTLDGEMVACRPTVDSRLTLIVDGS